MLGDEARQKLYALVRGQIHDLDAALSKPIDPTEEVDRLTDDHLGDAELAHEPAAVPARRQRRDHHRVPVAPPPATAPKRVGLAVKRGILLLDAPIPAPAQQLAISGEERRAYRNATLGQAQPGLLQCNLEHRAISHGRRSIGRPVSLTRRARITVRAERFPREGAALIISTMNDLPGYQIEEVLGEVFGLTVRSRNLGSQVGASLKSLVGGELKGMTKMLAEGREHAIERLIEEAEAKDANAIVGSASTRPSWARR